MAFPMSIAILALIAVIGALTWLLIRSERRNAALVEQFTTANREYAEYALKNAADTARNAPRYADKMLDSLASGIKDVTEGVTRSMQAIYGPVQHQEQQASAEKGDIATPWYGAEGSLDHSDPTDQLLIADPTEYPEGGSNLILDGDDEPFGIPGLKVGG